MCGEWKEKKESWRGSPLVAEENDMWWDDVRASGPLARNLLGWFSGELDSFI